jgi:hypothetical protein
MRRRRLAVRARDADEFEFARRMPLHFRRRTRQRNARIRDFDPRAREIGGTRALRDDAARAPLHDLPDKVVGVELRAANRHEETPRARLSRIMCDIRDNNCV